MNNSQTDIENRQILKPNKKTGECVRCGTCCKKGGPSLHMEDRVLVDNGIIPAEYLYTIRKGEPALDNVLNQRHPVSTDIIKIKGSIGYGMCSFFNQAENSCAIYQNRPVECRVLQCWDTGEIEAIYSKNRLTRHDLLSGVEGLWELIEDHHHRCSYEKIEKIVNAFKKNDQIGNFDELSEIIRYDNSIRLLVSEKGGVNPEMTDFLFGKPVMETLKRYGFKTKQDGDRIILSPYSP